MHKKSFGPHIFTLAECHRTLLISIEPGMTVLALKLHNSLEQLDCRRT